MKRLHADETLGSFLGSFDKLESYQGEESPQHNETL